MQTQNMDVTYRRQVANNVLTWLGGQGRLSAMINARDYVILDKLGGIQFKFSMNPKYSMCAIHLNGKDLYDMRIFKMRNGKIVREQVFNDLYGDMLKPVFEKTTQLYLSL